MSAATREVDPRLAAIKKAEREADRHFRAADDYQKSADYSDRQGRNAIREIEKLQAEIARDEDRAPLIAALKAALEFIEDEYERRGDADDQYAIRAAPVLNLVNEALSSSTPDLSPDATQGGER